MEPESHFINIGVLIYENGQNKDIEACECHLRRIFMTDAYTKTVLIPGEDPLTCYYLVKVKKGIGLNRLVSQALKKEVYGPAIIRHDYQDAERKRVLDFLLSQ